MRLGLNVVLGHGVPCPNDGLAGGFVKAEKKTEKPLAGSSVPAGKKKRPRRGTAPPCPYGRSTKAGKNRAGRSTPFGKNGAGRRSGSGKR